MALLHSTMAKALFVVLVSFERFTPEWRSGNKYDVNHHGQLALIELGSNVLKEMCTNSYTARS